MRTMMVLLWTLFALQAQASADCTEKVLTAGEKVPRSLMEAALKCFEDRITALEKEVATLKRSEVTKSTSPSKESRVAGASTTASHNSVKTIQGFDFALQACKREEGVVTCQILITNRKEDRKLVLRRESRALNPAGEEYESGLKKVGKETSTYSVANILVSNIPVMASVEFNEIPDKVESFSLVELKLSADGVREFRPAQFNNIPIID